MEIVFCPNCKKPMGYKRAFGFGTLFAVVLTCGIWLLFLVFYPKRCIGCGLEKNGAYLDNPYWRSPEPELRTACAEESHLPSEKTAPNIYPSHK